MFEHNYPNYNWAIIPSYKKIKEIFSLYLLFWILADILFAFFNLSFLYSFIYIFFSIFLKIIGYMLFSIYSEKLKKEPEKYFFLLCLISFSIYIFLFQYAKIIISFLLPTLFLTLISSVLFIGITQTLFLCSGFILFINQKDIKENKKIQIILKNTFYFMNFFCIVFTFLQKENNIDSVAFFFIALNLLFLTLLYHLFYKKDIYNQKV